MKEFREAFEKKSKKKILSGKKRSLSEKRQFSKEVAAREKDHKDRKGAHHSTRRLRLKLCGVFLLLFGLLE